MKWLDASQIVTGLVITGQLPEVAVRPELFTPPYDDIIKTYKSGVNDIEVLIEKKGFNSIQSAVEAARSIGGAKSLDWVSVLEETYAKYEIGVKLEKLAKKLKSGEDADLGSLQQLTQRYHQKMSQGLVSLADVVRKEVPFIPTGWEGWDEHFGGVPEVGLIVLGGQPGMGKTTAMAKLAGNFIKAHREKQVVVFSLEMVLNELSMRFDEVMKIPKKEQLRIKLDERMLTVTEMINVASTVENLGLVMIDFADLAIRGENSESKYAELYVGLMSGAKQLRVPIILLSQLNRDIQGIPKQYNLRYSGMAESVAWMIAMLYNPATSYSKSDDNEKESPLPIVDGAAYIIGWKIRGGFRKHLEDSPGAILFPFSGSHGWGNKGKWFSLRKFS